MKIPTLLRGLCAMLMIYTLAACSAGEGGGGSEASRRHAAMRAALPDSVVNTLRCSIIAIADRHCVATFQCFA